MVPVSVDKHCRMCVLGLHAYVLNDAFSARCMAQRRWTAVQPVSKNSLLQLGLAGRERRSVRALAVT